MLKTPNSAEPFINWLNISVSKLLEYQATTLPDQIAIENQNSSITYLELSRRSNSLSQMIQGNSEQKEYVVVLSTNFIENIVALFAGLKSGRAIVLLDPHSPIEMLTSALDSISCDLIITSSNDKILVEQLLEVVKGEPVVLYSDKSGSKDKSPDLGQSINKVAFIMFTSGSTGKPKGVIKSHRFIMHDLMIRAGKYQMTTKDRVMLTNDLFFARTLFTALSTIFGGATMVVKDLMKEGIDVLPKWLNENRITIFSPTGSMLRGLNAILSGSEFFPTLRILRIGAEAVNGRDLEMIKQCITNDCLIWINYGSTETGSICCDIFKKDRSIPHDILPVGKPFPGKQISIADENGNELPDGISGHVSVISKYLTSGYLHSDASDNDKYIFSTDTETTIYRTGDFGKLLPNGVLELEGRADQIVKIRGYRVDLSFVEMQMNQLPEVIEAAVVVQDYSLTKRLMAYVVLNQNVDKHELKGLLSQRLAAYMIPSHIEVIEALPRLSNGKIDRYSLMKLTASKRSEIQPQKKEQKNIKLFIKGLWTEALSYDDFGDDDSFFDIGGDSIGAAVMISDIEKHFQMELSSEVFWQDPTINGLADTIRLKSSQRDVGIENSGIPNDGRLTKKKRKLLYDVIEELKWPEGRMKLLKQRKVWPRLTFFWQRFSEESGKGRGLNFITDWCHIKLVKLILGLLSYSQAVKFITRIIKWGLVGLIIPRNRRKQIRTLNLRVTPNLLRSRLHKSYLFYILHEYQIMNRARAEYKKGRLKGVTVTTEGEEIFKEAIQKGKGVLLIGSHTCANLWFNCLDLDVFTIGGIRGVVKSYGLEKFKASIYTSLLNTAINRLKEGGVVKIVADGDQGSGIKYPYYIAGFRKEFFTGFAEVALHTEATAIPLVSYMADPYNVTVSFGKPLDYPTQSMEHSEQVKYLVSQYADLLQDQLVNFPWQVRVDHIIPADFIDDQSDYKLSLTNKE